MVVSLIFRGGRRFAGAVSDFRIKLLVVDSQGVLRKFWEASVGEILFNSRLGIK